MTFGVLKLLRLGSVRGKLLLHYSYKTTFNQNSVKKINYSSEVAKNKFLDAKFSSDKDRLLFYYENPTFYKVVNGFAFVQFLFWISISEFSLRGLKNLQLKEDQGKWPLQKILDINDDKVKKSLSIVSFFLGYVVLASVWLYTLRSVRMLVLRKDGKNVSIVTYGPFGVNRTLDVPLEKMSTSQTRETAKSYLPFRVQGKWFYYLLNTRNGKFKNPELFDFTAGVSRTFKK